MPTVLKSVLVAKPAVTRARIDIDYHGLASPWSTFNRKDAPTAALPGPVFGHIVETLVDRFVARAEALP